jgi:hypothetical protein
MARKRWNNIFNWAYMLKHIFKILYRANIDSKRAADRRIADYFSGAKVVDARIVAVKQEIAR